jgi:hypothetical protein
VAHAFDPALPIERPIADTLAIYARRLGLLLAIAFGNAVLLVVLWLTAKYPVFSAASISCLMAVVVMLALRPPAVIGAALKRVVLEKLPRLWHG